MWGCESWWPSFYSGCRLIVQPLSRVLLFATPWTAAHQAFSSFTISWSCSNSRPLSGCCHPTILSSVVPFSSRLQSFLASWVFSNESVLQWPEYWSFSFSIRPSNEYSGLISFRFDRFDLLAVKGLSRVFSNTTAGKYPFLGTRQWHPTPVLLPGKSPGWRSLVGAAVHGAPESDTTERLHFHFSLPCIEEGNGNPLQCSCLENPRDGEPGGLPSMGSHRVGHNLATEQ